MTITAGLLTNIDQHYNFTGINVTVVTDRKIQTMLRTNQIAGLVMVSSWKK